MHLYINPDKQLYTSSTYFIYDSTNWNINQNFTVSAPADSYTEGSQNYQVNLNLTEDTNGHTIQHSTITAFVWENITYSSFSPALGWMEGGTKVTVTMNSSLTGSTIDSVPTLNCYFGTKRVNGTLSGTKGIKCVVPSCQDANNGNACSGTDVSVAVSVQMGSAMTFSNLYFHYIQRPEVTGVSPSSGDPCCSSVATTVTLSSLSSSISNIDQLAYCKFGNMMTKATYEQGTQFNCKVPIVYRLKDTDIEESVDVQLTLNGQQYTTSGGSYTYSDSQTSFDSTASTLFVTVVVGLIILWLFISGTIYWWCQESSDKKRNKYKEPEG